MASPGQSTLFNTFTELVSTTYRAHRPEISDNVSNHNALYRYLIKKGRVRREDGGLSITMPLEYAENSTVQRYSGYDSLNIGAVDVITAAEFPWRQMAGNLAASGIEIRSNQGENRIVNLVKSKIKNLQRSLANTLSTDFYSAGSLTNQMNGLQALIADAGTGTVGGINSTTYSFWANTVQSAAAPLQGGAGITPSATTIESLMLPLWLRLTRGADAPTFIVADESYFTFYEQSQTSLKRYAADEEGAGGMVALRYKGAPVFHDSSASGIPSAHMYFVNVDYLEYVVHVDADLELMEEMKSVNQDAVVIPVINQANLAVSNRKLQGLIKA
jgi:hypothetical protein